MWPEQGGHRAELKPQHWPKLFWAWGASSTKAQDCEEKHAHSVSYSDNETQKPFAIGQAQEGSGSSVWEATLWKQLRKSRKRAKGGRKKAASVSGQALRVLGAPNDGLAAANGDKRERWERR